MNYYVITPNNNVRGPFASVGDAQQDIPDSHYTKLPDHVTDMKACCANIRSELPKDEKDAEMEHVETWVEDRDADPDETGYLIFSVDA